MSKFKIKCPEKSNLLDPKMPLKITHGSDHFILLKEGPEIYFLAEKKNRIIGRIYRSGSGTGAIYVGQDCIAEFYETGKTYTIRPVINGQFAPKKEQKGNPIDYFFSRLHNSLSNVRDLGLATT